MDMAPSIINGVASTAFVQYFIGDLINPITWLLLAGVGFTIPFVVISENDGFVTLDAVHKAGAAGVPYVAFIMAFIIFLIIALRKLLFDLQPRIHMIF